MTDNEIIKALECLMHDNCEDCPYYRDDCVDRIKDPIELSKYALDLINRKQAEIERLEKARQRQAYLSCNLRRQKYELMNRISVVKNEAYKEFAEIIKDKWFDNRYDSPDVGFDDFIDNVLKEMVGETNDT